MGNGGTVLGFKISEHGEAASDFKVDLYLNTARTIIAIGAYGNMVIV